MLFQLARTITRTNLWIGRSAAWLIFPLFAALLADVVARYLIGRPTTWTAELAVLIFGFYAIIGGGYLLAERGHVNVDIIYGSLDARRKAGLDLITAVLFFLFAGVLLWQGWSLASDSIARWERTRSAWNPPVWPVKSAIPLAAALLLLQGMVRVWADIRVLQNKPVDPEIFGAVARPQENTDGH